MNKESQDEYKFEVWHQPINVDSDEVSTRDDVNPQDSNYWPSSSARQGNSSSGHQNETEIDDKSVLVDLIAGQMAANAVTQATLEEKIDDLPIKEEPSVKEEMFDDRAVKLEVPEVDYKLSARVTVDLVPLRIQVEDSKVKIEREANRINSPIFIDQDHRVDQLIVPDFPWEVDQQEGVKSLLAGQSNVHQNIRNKKKPKILNRMKPPRIINLSKKNLCRDSDKSKVTLFTVFSDSNFETKLNDVEVRKNKDQNSNKEKEQAVKILPNTIESGEVQTHNNFDPLKSNKTYDRKELGVSKASPEAGSKCIENDTVEAALFDTSSWSSDDDREMAGPQESLKTAHKAKLGPKYVFCCELCNKKFDRMCKLKIHLQSKCGTLRLFSCDFCSKGFTTKFQMISHVKINHIKSRENVVYPCKICQNVFASKSNLQRHIRNLHEKNENIQSPLTCELCQKVFSNKKNLGQHRSRLHSEDNVTCGHCSKVYRCKTLLEGHIKRLHMTRPFDVTGRSSFPVTEKTLPLSRKKNFKCNFCEKSFTGKDNLQRHVLTHTDEKPFVCDINCNEGVKSLLAGQSNVHQNIRNQKKPKILNRMKSPRIINLSKKNLCRDSDKSKVTLFTVFSDSNFETKLNDVEVRKNKDQNSNKEKEQLVKILPNTIVSGLVQTHNSFDTLKSNKTYDRKELGVSKASSEAVNKCIENATVEAALFDTSRWSSDDDREMAGPQESLKTVHKAKLGPKYVFCCELCNKKFDRMCKLKIHLQSKCGTLRLFSCDFCSKGFSTKFQMISHVKINHIKSRENVVYPCKICQNVFASKGILQRHIKKLHEKNENIQSPLTCELCQKVFSNKRNLGQHRSRLHSEDNVTCGHCSKVYRYKTLLEAHIKRLHMTRPLDVTGRSSFPVTEKTLPLSRKKNFKCNFCEKSFTGKENLQRHMLTHTGEKPFVCDICGKCFRTESNLGQHFRIHSDKRPFSCNLCDSSFRIKNHLRQHMAVHGMASTSVKRKKNHETTNYK